MELLKSYIWEVSTSSSIILGRKQIADVSKNRQLMKSNQTRRSHAEVFFFLDQTGCVTSSSERLRRAQILCLFSFVNLRCLPQAHLHVQIVRLFYFHISLSLLWPFALCDTMTCFQTENAGGLGIGLIFSFSPSLRERTCFFLR